MSILYVPIRRLLYLSLGSVNEMVPGFTPGVFILCYHSISDDGWDFSVSLKEFKKQMNYLASKYQFVTLRDVFDYCQGKNQITKPSVVINFDDGYKDILQVRGFLKSRSIKPTVFVLSRPQNANREELKTDKKFLTKQDLLLLARDGWEIGSHTATHPNLDILKKTEIDDEIVKSKKSLEKDLGIPIKYLAFPKGRYSKTVILTVKKAGYKMALTMDDGFISEGMDALRVPRIGVDGTHSFSEFKKLFLPLNIQARRVLKTFGYGK